MLRYLTLLFKLLPSVSLSNLQLLAPPSKLCSNYRVHGPAHSENAQHHFVCEMSLFEPNCGPHKTQHSVNYVVYEKWAHNNISCRTFIPTFHGLHKENLGPWPPFTTQNGLHFKTQTFLGKPKKLCIVSEKKISCSKS